jgi:hypothetical protein
METSQHLIRQSEIELEQEDYLQAGEKAWGAVAAAIKSVAEQRGWFHNHHRLTSSALGQIAAEFNRPHLHDLFDSAEALHNNFYENTRTEEEVESRIDWAKHLLQELEAIRGEPPGPFTPQSNRQKRRWEELTGKRWDDHPMD